VKPTISIIRRRDIPSLHSVSVDGVERNLGVLKDFRKHPVIDEFMPEGARTSMSWVHLESGERLDVHVHPTETMIVVAHGHGRIEGDLEATFQDGDVIAIPRGCHHGFVGASGGGFWALSIQFEGLGLYEDPSAGRVRFGARASDGLSRLLAQNETLAEEHKKNPMFELVTSGRLSDDRRRARYLDAVQAWSNTFQKILLLRAATSEEQRFGALAKLHLDEEYDHNTKLAADRKADLRTIWDPELEAAAHWFVWKMLTLDSREKTVLVHLVLEVGSSVFHAVANPILSAHNETDYFAVHDEGDAVHKNLGIDLLENLDAATYQRLTRVQTEGWHMLNVLCTRMGELADLEQKGT
jgi:quercetin dioxygenase-like cupin family protein